MHWRTPVDLRQSEPDQQVLCRAPTASSYGQTADNRQPMIPDPSANDAASVTIKPDPQDNDASCKTIQGLGTESSSHVC